MDLPPIVEEEEREMPLRFQQLTRPVIEELPDVAENEERAIVLFKPINTPLFHSPSNFTVDSDLISAIKGTCYCLTLFYLDKTILAVMASYVSGR